MAVARQVTRQVLYPALILAAALVACLAMLWYGAPNGHSIQHNLMWLPEFSRQLAAGELYPRWLAGMNEGAGSPTFFYYAPLPFYFGALAALLCPSCSTMLQLALAETLLLALSGLAFYLFAREAAGRFPAFAGALLYMLLPYHYEFDLWRRQALGEFAAYLWLPLALHFVQRMARGRGGESGLALSYAGLVMSHLPSALLFSPFLLLHAAVIAWHGRGWRLLQRFAVAIVLGLLLASIYLFPALLMRDAISPEHWLADHFHYARWFFLDGEAEPDALFGDRLFLVLAITSAAGALFLLIARHCSLPARAGGLLSPALFICLAWVVMTPLSLPLWELLPMLQHVQFPWRVAIVIDLAAALSLSYAVACLRAAARPLSFAALAAAAALLLYAAYTGNKVILWRLDPFQSAAFLEDRRANLESRRDAREYLPARVEAGRDASLITVRATEPVCLEPGKGSVQVERWQARDIALQVDLAEAATALVRQYYYPGWQARIGQDTPLEVEPSGPTGLLKLALPAGRYRLTLELAPRGPEIAGRILSGAGLLLLVLRGLIGLYRQRRGAPAP